MSLFVDVMYANITAGTPSDEEASASIPSSPAASRATVSMDYEQFTMEFGGTYRSPRSAQTAAPKGRAWRASGRRVRYRARWPVLVPEVDMTLNAAQSASMSATSNCRAMAHGPIAVGQRRLGSIPSSAFACAIGWRRDRI